TFSLFMIPLSATSTLFPYTTLFRSFTDNVTLRFGTLNLVRSDWRRYDETLVEDVTNQPVGTNTGFDVTTLNIINNAFREPIPYVLPPGLVREQLNQNNTIINQNEQALSLRVYKQSQN